MSILSLPLAAPSLSPHVDTDGGMSAHVDIRDGEDKEHDERMWRKAADDEKRVSVMGE